MKPSSRGRLHVEQSVDAELVHLEELTSEPEGAGELEEESTPAVEWLSGALVLRAESDSVLKARDMSVKR